MLRNFKSMLKIGFWTALTLIFGAVTNKIIAVFLGVSGVGYFSIYRQLQQLFVSIATFSGDTAIIQGIASRDNRERKNYAISIRNLIIANIALTFILSAVVILIFGSDLLNYIKAENSTKIYLILVAGIFSSLNVYFLGLLNGNGGARYAVKSQAIAAALGLLCSIPLVKIGGEDYLAYILILISIINLIASSYFCKRFDQFYRGLISIAETILNLKYFFSISITTLIVGVSGASTLLWTRLMVVTRFGIEGAGIFDAAWTLSSMSLVLFLSTFSSYFLPKLSSHKKSGIKFNHDLNQLIHYSIIASILIIVPMIILKPILFSVFYSNNFKSSIDILKWMIVGDFFKITGWALSIPLLARRDMKPYLFLSVLWNIIFIAFNYLMLFCDISIQLFGISYLATQIIYVVLLLFYWKSKKEFYLNLVNIKFWIYSLIFIIFYSIIFWRDTNIDFVIIFFATIFTIIFLFFLNEKIIFSIVKKSLKNLY